MEKKTIRREIRKIYPRMTKKDLDYYQDIVTDIAKIKEQIEADKQKGAEFERELTKSKRAFYL